MCAYSLWREHSSFCKWVSSEFCSSCSSWVSFNYQALAWCQLLFRHQNSKNSISWPKDQEPSLHPHICSEVFPCIKCPWGIVHSVPQANEIKPLLTQCKDWKIPLHLTFLLKLWKKSAGFFLIYVRFGKRGPWFYLHGS